MQIGNLITFADVPMGDCFLVDGVAYQRQPQFKTVGAVNKNATKIGNSVDSDAAFIDFNLTQPVFSLPHGRFTA